MWSYHSLHVVFHDHKNSITRLMSYHSPLPVGVLRPSQLLRLEPDLKRERSLSTGDFQAVTMMDTTPPTEDRESNSISPPLISRDARSHSVTPQPMRNHSGCVTLGRPKMSRGKTIDTSSIKKVEHEVCSWKCLFFVK